MKLLDGVRADAVFSSCGTYRYGLMRDWGGWNGQGHALWVMLNPSTATAEIDDPTIRRCQTFAIRWGLEGITVVNLFAFRSTQPAGLSTTEDPVGPRNDAVLAAVAASDKFKITVAAWGRHGVLQNRGATVAGIFAGKGRTLHRVAPVTRNGQPGHPLYVKGDAEPVPWSPG